MHHAETQVGCRVRGTSYLVVAVQPDVGVMDAGDLNIVVANLDPATPVVGVEPASTLHALAEFTPGQVGHFPIVLTETRSPEVPQRVLDPGREQVVGAVDEHAGPVQERAEGGQQRLDG